MKQKCCEKKTECKKQSGSTMVGVLAATVFIGIVTTFMVNNTKSQSQTSRGYGTVSEVSSTQNSGIIATQRHLVKPAVAQQFLTIAQAALATGLGPHNNTPLITGANGTRRSIRDGRQAFSSQLIGPSIRVVTAESMILGAISVNSGRNANQGGFQRTAVSYGQFAGIDFVQGTGTIGNAMSLDGGTNAVANSRLTINGGFSADNRYTHQRTVTVNGVAWLPMGTNPSDNAAVFTATHIMNERLPDQCRDLPFDMGVVTNLANRWTVQRDNNVTNITRFAGTAATASPGGATIYAFDTNAGNIRMIDLDNVFQHANTNGRLWNGSHVVLEINGNLNWDPTFPNSTFTNNFIFIVNATLAGTTLPVSGPNSSVMIYLSDNATGNMVQRQRCRRPDGTEYVANQGQTCIIPARAVCLNPFGPFIAPGQTCATLQQNRNRCQRDPIRSEGDIYITPQGAECNQFSERCRNLTTQIIRYGAINQNNTCIAGVEEQVRRCWRALDGDIVHTTDNNCPAGYNNHDNRVNGINIGWDSGETYEEEFIEFVTMPETQGRGRLENVTFSNNFRGVIYIPPGNQLNPQQIMVNNAMTFTGAIQINGSGVFQINESGTAHMTIEAAPAVINSFGIPRIPRRDHLGNLIPNDPNINCGGDVETLLTLPANGGVDFIPFSFYYF